MTIIGNLYMPKVYFECMLTLQLSPLLLHYESSAIFCFVCVISGSSYSYEDEGRPARGSKAAIPPPMYEDSDRPRSPPGPTSSFLANMG